MYVVKDFNPEVIVGLLVCVCLILLFAALVWLGKKMHYLDEVLYSQAKLIEDEHTTNKKALEQREIDQRTSEQQHADLLRLYEANTFTLEQISDANLRLESQLGTLNDRGAGHTVKLNDIAEELKRRRGGRPGKGKLITLINPAIRNAIKERR